MLLFTRHDGTTFVVPPEDVHVKGLKIGDVVSFSYSSFSRRGSPANPTVYKKRDDVAWSEISNDNQHLYGMKYTFPFLSFLAFFFPFILLFLISSFLIFY